MYSDLNSIPSERILDVMLAIDLLQQGKESSEKAGDELQKLVKDLEQLGLDDENILGLRAFDGIAFWGYLKNRDGADSWELSQDILIKKIFEAIHEEFLNLKKIAEGKQGNLEQAMKFCQWMHDRARAVRTPIRYNRLAAVA